MKDRVPVNPGRVLITPENGSAAYYATMTRADNPTQEGTPLNKSSLLTDTTAAKLGLGADAVPDDAFNVLSRFHSGLGNEYVWKKARLETVYRISLGTRYNANIVQGFDSSTQITYYYSDSVRISTDHKVELISPSVKSVISGFEMGTALSGKYFYITTNRSPFTAYEVYKCGTYANNAVGDNINASYQHVFVESLEEPVLVSYVNSPNSNAYPVDDGYTYKALGQFGAKVQVATGSYTGTGTAGSGNKNSITFDFEPKLVFVATAYTAQLTNYYQGYFVRGCATAYAFAGNFSSNHNPSAPNAAVLNVTWSGNGLTWYHRANTPQAVAQLNGSYTYHYVAIG